MTLYAISHLSIRFASLCDSFWGNPAGDHPERTAPFRIVLYRRMMIRIAQELARREQCWALVTGDSLGQVASQTPQNLCAIEEAAELPILRPLIGMDKREIIDEAETSRHLRDVDRAGPGLLQAIRASPSKHENSS